MFVPVKQGAMVELRPERLIVSKERLVAVVLLCACAALVAWSYWTGGVVAVLFDPNVSSQEKVDALRMFFNSWGPLAPLAYIALVVIEAVIAPIPGAILYLPGGVIFGGFWGGTLALIGNVVAAGLCCVLMRTLVGRSWSRDFFASGRLSRTKEFILKHGVLSIALLRVNPLTSSDIVSYAAGLTPLSATTVMLGTLVGMAPLCYIQSYLSMSLFTLFPWLIWPLLVSCLIYAVLAAMAIRRLRMPQLEEIG
jgi:uncharacterized membrane protein YdjX (TVP38/TMEM64 family)